MASNPPGACCISTHFHDGKAAGKFETVFGLDTYVSGSGALSVVILTDIYGHKYNNVLLIADEFAKAGYLVYIPDILKGDPVPATQEDLSQWIGEHPVEVTDPIVDGFLSALRKKVGGGFIGVVGYCYGGRYSIRQIGDKGHADAAAVAHPSLVQIEEVKAIKKPLLISAAEVDPIFTTELRHKTEETLVDIGATYELDLFSGVLHGFAVRGDIKHEPTLYAMKKALADQLAWFARFDRSGKSHV